MICTNCADRHHDGCRGGSWCDCQHKLPEVIKETKYGMYVSPEALDPEALASLIAELPESNGAGQ